MKIPVFYILKRACISHYLSLNASKQINVNTVEEIIISKRWFMILYREYPYDLVIKVSSENATSNLIGFRYKNLEDAEKDKEGLYEAIKRYKEINSDLEQK